jgi:hypothetical protein
MALSGVKKVLDMVRRRPYATPSMSSPLSPEMLARGSFPVHSWTERGDLKNGRQEEGSEEGVEEEEVSASGKRGGGPITLPVFFVS